MWFSRLRIVYHFLSHWGEPRFDSEVPIINAYIYIPRVSGQDESTQGRRHTSVWSYHCHYHCRYHYHHHYYSYYYPYHCRYHYYYHCHYHYHTSQNKNHSLLRTLSPPPPPQSLQLEPRSNSTIRPHPPTPPAKPVDDTFPDTNLTPEDQKQNAPTCTATCNCIGTHPRS